MQATAARAQTPAVEDVDVVTSRQILEEASKFAIGILG